MKQCSDLQTSPTANTADARGVPGQVVLLAMAALLALTAGWLMWRASYSATTDGKRIVCAANLRAIGNALQDYADAAGGLYPESLQQLVDLRLLIPRQLVSPLSGHEPPACDYVYLRPVAPPSADARSWWILAHALSSYGDGDGANALFANGSVAFLAPDVLTEKAARLQDQARSVDRLPPTVIPPSDIPAQD